MDWLREPVLLNKIAPKTVHKDKERDRKRKKKKDPDWSKVNEKHK